MIDIALVEDHEKFRDSLVFLLNGEPGLRCTGHGSVEAAMAAMAREVPDVVLMDIDLPGTNGIEGTRAIRQQWPQVQVLICTVHEDDEKIFSALRAGATGYLLKRAPIASITAAIHELMDGGSPMSPAIARRVVRSFQPGDAPDGPDALTPREQEVLDLMCTGLRDKAIAERLGVSFNTVRTHVRHIYEKLHVQGRVQAIRKARG